MAMKLHIIEPDVPLLSKQATATCRKAWRILFSQLSRRNVVPASTDVLLWVLMANSANVLLTPRSTSKDEEDPEWESPDDEVGFTIEGLCEELNRFRGAKGKRDRDRIRNEFYNWMTAAIVDSFHSASIQKLYKAYNPKALPLSVFWSPREESMRYDTQRLLWSNKRGLIPKQARQKQTALQKGAKYKAVRKKTPSEIKAMGGSETKSDANKTSAGTKTGTRKKATTKSRRRKVAKKKK